MWTIVVIAVQPVCNHVPDLLQGIKDIAVQYLSTVRSVESFHIGVLCWFSRLDVIEGNASGLGPIGQRVGDEFRPVVQAYRQRHTTYLNQLVQGPDDPRSGQAGVNLNAQCFPVEFVDDIEGAELAPLPQCIRHEVTTPALIGLIARFKGFPDTCRQAILAPPW